WTALRCCWALMLRTGWVVVRRTVRVSSPPRSMVMTSAATWTVTIWRAWMRPRAIFCPATMMTPVLLATLWAVTGLAEGRGGEAGQVRGGQVRADRLDPGSADAQVDHLGAGPERDHHPGACRAEPELLAQDLHVPAGRHRPGELHRSAAIGTGQAARVRVLR